MAWIGDVFLLLFAIVDVADKTHVMLPCPDTCMFYEGLSVYEGFGGVVFALEEGKRIAEAMGPSNKNLILQNHGYVYATSCRNVFFTVPHSPFQRRLLSIVLLMCFTQPAHSRQHRRRSCRLFHRPRASVPCPAAGRSSRRQRHREAICGRHGGRVHVPLHRKSCLHVHAVRARVRIDG